MDTRGAAAAATWFYQRRRVAATRWVETTGERRRYRDADAVDLRWGGHKCAADWWWQFVRSRPSLKGPPGSCAAKCLYALDRAQKDRASFTDVSMKNHTPLCADPGGNRTPGGLEFLGRLGTRPLRAARKEGNMNLVTTGNDWDAAWPPLDESLRPPDPYRPSLFSPFVPPRGGGA